MAAAATTTAAATTATTATTTTTTTTTTVATITGITTTSTLIYFNFLRISFQKMSKYLLQLNNLICFNCGAPDEFEVLVLVICFGPQIPSLCKTFLRSTCLHYSDNFNI
jgi:hypothetical protein